MKYYVYIVTNRPKGVLYIGVTNNLPRRVFEHRQKIGSIFTAKYWLRHLVYAVPFDSPEEAIATEKKLKGWTRQKKIDLIESVNQEWLDLLPEAQDPFAGAQGDREKP